MIIELAVLNDGRLLMSMKEPLPDIVKRVEYYADQKLLNLVFKKIDDETKLLEREVPDQMIHSVEKSPEVIIYTLFTDHDPVGYKVPLVKVGNLH
jgi:predicted metal-dependent peptidase